MSEKKKSGLEGTLKEIRKKWGEDAIQNSDYKNKNLDIIPTGAPTLDLALGIGGVPKGRIIEVFGHESSGKTTLASHIVAEAQALGETAAFIDVEHAYDMNYAEEIGVDRESLIFAQPDSGDAALEMCAMLIDSGEVDLVVIDSVANLTPQSEVDGGKVEMGGIARLMSGHLRKLTSKAKNNNCCLLFINQIRMKIGVMFGSPETTPGGKALKFHASVRIRTAKKAAMKDSDDFIGNRTVAKVVKNKVGPPLKVAEFDIIYGKGIDKVGCIIDLGVEHDIIKKSSSYYTMGGTKINGRTKAVEFLKDNDELLDEIYRGIIRKEVPHLIGSEDNPDVETEEEELEDAAT
jgi:recombination protein RecA